MIRFDQLHRLSLAFCLMATIVVPALLLTRCNMLSRSSFSSKDKILSSGTAMADIYVSPTGNDSNNGTSAFPFQSLTRAQQAVRAITPVMTGDIIVHLAGGTYSITTPLSFNSTDGGAGPYKVVYEASPGQTPVVDGGYAIPRSAWQVHDASKNIWRAYVGTSFDFRQCYVVTTTGQHHNTPTPNDPATPQYPYGGTPLPLSVETPSYDSSGAWERRAIKASAVVPTGTLSITGEGYGYLTLGGFWSNLSKWSLPFGGVIGDNDTTGQYAQDMEFVYHLTWNLPRVHPASIGVHQGMSCIIMQQPAFYLARTKGGTQISASWTGTGQPDWIENAYALLSKGQWYFDKYTGWLFYIPLDNEPAPDSSSIQFVVPRAQGLLNVAGTSSNRVLNLEFKSISFKHANWLVPNEYGVGFVDVQDNVYLYQGTMGLEFALADGAVMATWASNIAFERCNFSKLGSAGMKLQYTNDSIVRGCIFDDISGTGINVGGYDASIPEGDSRVTSNVSIVNNVFTNIAVEYKGGCAIWAGYVQRCRFDHNYVIGCPYSGISGGWGWSYAITISHDNSYQYNEITNYGMEMQDGGAIYTLSLQNNTRVEHNHIHDGGGSGLYPDEQTAQTIWRYNVVYRSGNSLDDHTLGETMSSTSIRENVIVNNYFDMYPITEPDRQQTHISKNTWSINVGNDVNKVPDPTIMANVAGAGLEPAYQDLLAGIEPVHKKDRSGMYWTNMEVYTNPFSDNTLFICTCSVAIVVIASMGVIAIAKKPRPVGTRPAKAEFRTRKTDDIE